MTLKMILTPKTTKNQHDRVAIIGYYSRLMPRKIAITRSGPTTYIDLSGKRAVQARGRLMRKMGFAG